MYLPSVTQWYHMVNVHICCRRPRRAIIRTKPTAARARARRVGNYIRAVALEDLFARITCACLSDPVREQVAGVSCLRALSGDGQTGELGAGFGCGGDIWGRAGNERCWGGGDEGKGGEGEEESGFHCCCVWDCGVEAVLEVCSGQEMR
jgi:hypothetical protein